ncbi:dicarboxylate/amino acid:cation symporter [Natranaerobius thermophilus]|uniref:Sodium:dicarboxylate symporter n=1 Tax=Natranaerobius thermophilus (strain ATCC BAA-1301 / DSM 18059 / JW/NM-WN-LF) TaxID=457570 RepID=B2A0T5_NATTJ|nr:dicarboxylate/amino acid:cation symporter [Natranaerobius thermophilus]ACB85965.1 sodium:dicarboxylate symporter [Natranaerobius thermophilus JW/NM-WN-LF]
MAEGKGILRKYFEIPFIQRMGVAFVLGIIVGLIVGEPIKVIEPLGDLFLRLLMMVVIPIIVFTLITAMKKLTPSQLGRVGGQTVGIYILTTIVAIIIGLTMANLFNPGLGLELPGEYDMDPEEAPSMIDVFLNLFPENVVEAMAEAEVLQVLIFAIIFGIALAFVRESSDNEEVKNGVDIIFNITETASEAMFKIVRGVMEYGVIGVFALLAVTFGEAGPEALVEFGLVILTFVLAVGIHMLIIYGVILNGVILRKSPLRFIKGTKEILLTAFATRSSAGVLPISMRTANENLKIDEKIYSFTLPLGATINMDGTAMYQGVAAIFAANLVGESLTLVEQITIVTTTVLASIGTAGVPGSGMIMLSMVLTQLGLPLGVVAFVAGVDPILDAFRTMNNVAGDLSVTSVVAKYNDGIDLNSGAWVDFQDEGESTDSGTSSDS